MINGVTKLIMTKSDVLDTFEQLNVCTSYKVNGEATSEIPFQMSRVNIEPVLEAFKGLEQGHHGAENAKGTTC